MSNVIAIKAQNQHVAYVYIRLVFLVKEFLLFNNINFCFKSLFQGCNLIGKLYYA